MGRSAGRGMGGAGPHQGLQGPVRGVGGPSSSMMNPGSRSTMSAPPQMRQGECLLYICCCLQALN